MNGGSSKVSFSEYFESQLYIEIKEMFTRKRKNEELCHGDVHHYVCKYSRKKKYIPYPHQLKIIFSSDSQEVNNQGIEGINKSVKESHKFRKILPLGTFVEVVLRMCHEWGREDSSLLDATRKEILFSKPDGLKLRSAGYLIGFR